MTNSHSLSRVLWPSLLILLACLSLPAESQGNQWAWMGGSSTVGSNGGQSGVYGTLRVPAAGNIPGARIGSANWTDSSGHFWLLGGYGYDANGDFGYLNDLWQFNPSAGEWAWMGGSDTVGGHGGQPGVYGTLGSPAAGNTPGSRAFAASWTDRSGNLWLFGGWDYDVNSIAGELNDLWEFNPSTTEWAWMGGSDTVGPHDGQSGVYGTLGTPAAGNTPGGLFAPSSWTDSSSNFWLFGGQGYDANGNFHELNSLWKFDPSTTEWAWEGGSKTVDSNGDVPGIYGTLGTPAAGNIPGNRSDATSWAGGGLWLFGGNGYDEGGNGGNLNDLWQFDPVTGEWAWINGSSAVGSNGAQPGTYGTLGILSTGNTPGGRSSATGWTDFAGNLWLFGGFGADADGNGGYLNDVWLFNPASNDWAWMNGSSAVGANGGQPGVYGTLGSAAAGNTPGGRNAASGWTDTNGNLWLFGGYGFDAAGNLGYLNDLWKFSPANATLSAAIPVFSPPAGNYTSAQSVTISDATPAAIIYYTTNGITPTTSSAVYSSAIAIASTETLKAIAVANSFSNSAVATAVYTINIPAAAAPTFSPAPGTYTSPQSVTISDATTAATIYYTTNGTTPTTASAIYTEPITVAATETIQAIAAATGSTSSAVATAVYTINIPATAAPTFAPAPGTYTSAQTVTISDAIAAATIYYTTNGTAPTTASAIYTGPITVPATEAIQAFAAANGYASSAVTTAVYTINIPAATAPTFSPAPGTYTSTQTVTISDPTTAATIYYTTNGTTPTTSSPIYTGPITVPATEAIQAFAVANGYTSSAIATAVYTINIPAAAAPTFSPAPGTYTSVQSVTISDSTTAATIYYTTNGTTPTTSSAIYTGPITVPATETIQAIAAASGDTNSTVATAAYSITPPAPAFTIGGTPVTLAPGAATANTSTITITPMAGFVGAVGLSVALSASPVGAQNTPTFSFGSTSPVAITGAAAATATLTVFTTSGSSAALAYPARPGSRASVPGAAALACVLLMCVPASRRWRAMLSMIVLFAALAGGAVACAPSITRNTIVGDPGTTPGTYTVTVTGTSGATAETGTITVTVQ